MALLTWEEIDACQSAEEIAELLRKHKVKGFRNYAYQCPLAVATDWEVNSVYRLRSHHLRWLTLSESLFIKRFDMGDFSDLQEESE